MSKNSSTSGANNGTTGYGATVFNRERAAGVHPDLQNLLDDWIREGSHDVIIGGGGIYPNGGLRTDAQAQADAAANGLTNATTLKMTPHGRGAALDVWPVGFNPNVAWDYQPAAVKQMFLDFGSWAEGKGFTWGGRWSSATFPNGDQPHIEMKNWLSLPYPPPNYFSPY